MHAGRRGPKVYLSEPALRGLGVPTEESCVVELIVRRPEGAVRRMYARWEPVLGFMELFLGGAGFTAREEVEVLGARRYGLEAFVEDFQARRMRELENVELGTEGGALTARVDGRMLSVQRHWLATHGLKAVLKMEFGRDHRIVKVAFDGRSMEARFGNSDAILELGVAGSGVDVRYSRGAGQAYVMRMRQRPAPTTFGDLGWMEDQVRVSERPDPALGGYTLQMSETIRDWVLSRLNGTIEASARKKLRGDVGEGIVRTLWRDLRMKPLYEHPWSELDARCGSRQPGPDFMVSCEDSGLVAYVEVKWWEDFARAIYQSTKQVRDYVRDTPIWMGLKVGGGYIAVLDWNISKTASLWVERVT